MEGGQQQQIPFCRNYHPLRFLHQQYCWSIFFLLSVLAISLLPPWQSSLVFDYRESLSLLYFESQRSGRLPHNQRVTWRSDSGLTYGLEQVTQASLAEAIKSGTHYFIKAHIHPNVLWVQRPEDMTTSRRAYKVDAENPGSEVAAETAAAMAAAAIVFREHKSTLLQPAVAPCSCTTDNVCIYAI
ncbi:hypothetical protein SAY86_000078 [Trapa natans]|uniref:cellulase n=1 Tax=Trapa natans TaxID=22666 RepID=A0AAN7RGB1_TRANT|nr:hypothetical protein SAY86_000078 [Trapa natans]